MMNVICLLPVLQRHKQKLEEAAEGARFIYTTAAELSVEQVSDADYIIGNVPPGLIAASDRLQVLQLGSAGADPYIVPGVLSEKTRLLNATGALSGARSLKT